MKKNKIYTRTGDKGSTSLIGGKRVSKASPRLEAYGTLDELNSHIGLLMSQMPKSASSDIQFLTQIQRDLFNVGTLLATVSAPKVNLPSMDKTSIETLESNIDSIESQLPQIHSFIMPAGTVAACEAHVCRTICRRAERHIVRLAHVSKVDPNLLCYVNRLSDYFFLLARKLNFLSQEREIMLD